MNSIRQAASAFFEFLRQAHSENGQGSWSRLTSSGAFVAAVVWVSVVVHRLHTIPDLSGVIAFICAPYSVNLIHGMITNVAASKYTGTNGNGTNGNGTSNGSH